MEIAGRGGAAEHIYILYIYIYILYIYIYIVDQEPFTQSNPSSSIAFPLKKLSLEWFPGNKNCLFTQE